MTSSDDICDQYTCQYFVSSGQLPHKHKVVIAGNHDLSFDTDFLKEGGQLRRFGMWPDDIDDYMTSKNITRMADVLTNCTAYLEDTETTIYGIRIYGSPWFVHSSVLINTMHMLALYLHSYFISFVLYMCSCIIYAVSLL